jgi:hypothetical protein
MHTHTTQVDSNIEVEFRKTFLKSFHMYVL